MSGISVLRKDTDVSAPTLLCSLGSVVPWLKAILVTGYNGNPGLGWEVVWEQANKVVFRNQGTRMFVRFEQTDKYRASVQAFESMTNIDTGVLPCPVRANESNTSKLLFGYSAGSDSTALPWIVLGDDKGVWVGFRPSVNQYGATHVSAPQWKFIYIGDYIPYDPANTQFNFGVFQDDNADSNVAGGWYFGGLDTTKDHYHILRNPDRTEGSIKAGLSSGTGYNYTGSLGDGDSVCGKDSEIQFTSIPEIHVGVNIIGRLPGLKNSLSKKGNNGIAISTYDAMLTDKPEMTFDYGNSKDHFFVLTTPSGNGYPAYIVLTEGQGFRTC
jgi:hypothetical protein